MDVKMMKLITRNGRSMVRNNLT